MKSHHFTKALAVLLTITIVAPSAFLVTPPSVHALGVPTLETNPVLIGDETTTAVETTIDAVHSVLSWALDVTNTAANYAGYINTYILQPLAFVLSGNLMKALTASVIQFVIGKANGTGVPQFVMDVQRSLQTVGDSQALAYLNSFGRNSNSPFASSISSALRNDYLSKTSLAGFWAANMNTLARSSPSYRPDFLAGNWSHGGVAAWFALTTQTQNNPYTYYQASQSQMAGLVGPGVGGATGARLASLGWGQGFMSWCGTSDATTQANNTAVNDAQYALNESVTAPVPNSNGKFPDTNGVYYSTEADATKASTLTSAAETANNRVAGINTSSNGINPGDPCSNKDGTAGTIQTPGSIIKSTLDKVLGGQQDQIVRMGNVGPQINQILGNITSVMQTVNFAANLLGGSSGGLFGVGGNSASNPTSRLAQFAPEQEILKDKAGNPLKDASGNTMLGNFTSGYLNANTTSINANNAAIEAAASANAAVGVSTAAATAAASSVTSVSEISSRITKYESAWNTIKASANIASTSVQTLAKSCTDAVVTASNNNGESAPDATFINAATAQATAAQTALTTEIAPVLAQAATALATVVTARATVQKAQFETSSTTADAIGNAAGIQTLQTNLSPTATDAFYAEMYAQALGTPARNPDRSPNTSLTVATSPSIVDQMNNISKNATALKDTVCNPLSSLYITSTF